MRGWVCGVRPVVDSPVYVTMFLCAKLVKELADRKLATREHVNNSG
jgi:hypothetical protein